MAKKRRAPARRDTRKRLDTPAEVQRPILQDDAIRQDWLRRRTRNMILGLLLAIVAIGASLGYAIHNAIGRIDTDVAAQLGPTTADAPVQPLGHFRKIGTELRHGGKPEVLMVGTLSCDNCAAERWALLKALGRFGTWSNLKDTTTSTGIPTFDLLSATYSSWYVALAHRNIRNTDGSSLQTLTKADQKTFHTYDPDGVMPLLVVGRYAMIGQGVPPQLLSGRDFRTVQIAMINNKSTSYTGPINAEANLITAMLCKADGGNPTVFCGRSEIQRIASRLR